MNTWKETTVNRIIFTLLILLKLLHHPAGAVHLCVNNLRTRFYYESVWNGRRKEAVNTVNLKTPSLVASSNRSKILTNGRTGVSRCRVTLVAVVSVVCYTTLVSSADRERRAQSVLQTAVSAVRAKLILTFNSVGQVNWNNLWSDHRSDRGVHLTKNGPATVYNIFMGLRLWFALLASGIRIRWFSHRFY